jgi:hypothetical protein
MYTSTRLRERPRHSRRRLVLLSVSAVIVVGAALFAYQQFERYIQPTPIVTATAGPGTLTPTAQIHHFNETSFAFDAPPGWRLIRHDSVPYNLYSYRGSHANSAQRYLDIYVDSIPLALAVNRIVAVQAQGAKLSYGQVSGNCVTFTSSTSGSVPQPLSVSASWGGVQFLCDIANSTHNVVGTSSPGLVNEVTLTGPSQKAHSFFFVYTDNNPNPDYTVFYGILASFTVK